MTIVTESTETATIVSLQGQINSTNAVATEAQVLTLVDAGARHLLLDFSALEYISSAGLRMVLVLAKRLKQESGLLVQQAAHHLEQRLAPRLDALEQPARFLQLRLEIAGIAVAALADHLFVAAVDGDARQGVAGQCCAPHAALAPHHAVRHHVGIVRQVADLRAGHHGQRCAAGQVGNPCGRHGARRG